MSDISRPFSPAQLAERWGTNKRTVLRICKAGKIRCFQVGREYRVTPDALREYEGKACNTGSATIEASGASPGETMGSERNVEALDLLRARRTAQLLRPQSPSSPPHGAEKQPDQSA